MDWRIAMFWTSALALLVGLPLAVELGYRAHRRLWAPKSDPDGGGEDGGAGQLAASALALLGLLIGFTFAMSAERFETRRALVVAEANAIGTVALRDQLLGQPASNNLASLIARYAGEREAYFKAGNDPAALAASSARSAALQSKIWNETAAALRAPDSSSLATPVLNATNEMFDLASSREAAREARVPAPVIWVVDGCAVVAALLSGYALAAGRRRHHLASSVLFVLVGATLVVILDIDQPRGGLIQASQNPLTKVAQGLRDAQPPILIKPAVKPDQTPPQTPP
jgi:hypothetical protein